MDRESIKHALIAVLLALVLPSAAHAQEFSQIQIEVQGPELVATNVFDDDGSIGLVDIFIASSGSVNRYQFSGVEEGTVFDVAFSSDSSIYYNFMDNDGAIVNLQYFIFVLNPQPPEEPTPVQPKPKVFLGKTITPRLAEGNRSFYLDVSADINSAFSAERAVFFYSFTKSGTRTSVPMIKNGDTFTATAGPFTGKIYPYSGITVYNSSGKKVTSGFGSTVYHLIASDVAACALIGVPASAAPSTVTETPTIQFEAASFDSAIINEEISETINLANEGNAPVILLQGSSQFSWIKIVNQSGQLVATSVYDNDDSIGFVDVFVVRGSSSQQFSFTNVKQGQTLNASFSDADTVYYNFMDIDGSIVNLQFFLPVDEDEAFRPPLPSQKVKLIESVEFEARPNDNYSAFFIDVELTPVEGATVETAKVFYRFGRTSKDETVFLSKSGEKFTGTIGPVSGEVFFYSNTYAYDGLGNSSRVYTDAWYAVIPPHRIKCVEICGNFKDDDNDDLIDEDCVLLSELIFTQKNIPSFSVVGKPLNVSATVKNAGVSNAASFDVVLLLNNQLVDSVTIAGLETDGSAEIYFSVEDTNDFFGVNELKLVIDPSNSVPELNELNNEALQSLVIGFNQFNVIFNYNDADFLGDTRHLRVFDRLGKPVANANVSLTFPSGTVREFDTNAGGFIIFDLIEPGAYLVDVSKEEFDPFQGAFSVARIVLPDFKETVAVGETLPIIVQTEDGQIPSDIIVEVELPNGERQRIELSDLGRGEFRALVAGSHKLIVTRKGFTVFEASFLATGFFESVFVGAGAGTELLFGSIIRQPVLFLILVVISLLAAAFAHTKSILLFPRRPKSSREKQIEDATRIGIAILLFILPFQVDRFFGFNAALAFVVLEIASILISDYFYKQSRRRKAIRVR